MSRILSPIGLCNDAFNQLRNDIEYVKLPRLMTKMSMWILNLRSCGSLNWEADDQPEFTITDIAGECFRFSAKGSGLNYWVDLIDEQQAEDLSTKIKKGS